MGVVRSGLGARLAARLAARAALDARRRGVLEQHEAAERLRRRVAIHVTTPPPQPPVVVVRNPRAGWGR